MSGMSPDDIAKEEILIQLKKLRVSAEINADTKLIEKLDALYEEIYRLETY